MILTAATAAVLLHPHTAAVRVVHVALPSREIPRGCLALTPLRRGRVTAVLRVARQMRSVTMRRDGDPHLYACDSTGVRSEGRVWCDAAAGILRGRRLIDPRLELLCRDRKHRVVATAWVDPVRRARTIVVAGVTYGVAAGLPVRVATTSDVDYAHARATFAIRQYDRKGRLIKKGRLTARVSG